MFKINEEFKSAPEFKTVRYTYIAIAVVLCVLPWLIPVVLYAPFIVTLAVVIPIALVFIPLVIWIPLYYETIVYKLTGDEIQWKRGVWFKKTGIVPYNRITNIDVTQGPISRRFGIADLKIQTAGYSAPSYSASELKIYAAKESEELKEFIMQFVRRKKPEAVETYEITEDNTALNELIKIRKLLEKYVEK